MDRRRSPRIKVVLPVRIWGLDSQNRFFAQDARTVEVSKSGATLQGVSGVNSGGIIALNYRGTTGCFRIVWVGRRGSPREDQIGIRSVEPAVFKWNVVRLPGLKTSSGDKSDQRRKHVRYPCKGVVVIRGEIPVEGVLDDISLKGCHIRSKVPFAIDTPLSLELSLNGTQLWIMGRVQTVDAAGNIGISFGEVSPLDQVTLKKLIRELANSSVRVVLGPRWP